MQVRKTLSLLIASIALLPLFTSCDASVDFWDERAYTVDLPAGSMTSAKGDDQLIDLSQQSEIKDKLSALKGMDVSEIWIEVPQVYPDNKATKASGKLFVKGPNATDQDIEIGEYKDLVISAGGKIEIIPDAKVVDQIKTWAMAAPYKFSISYQGDLDQVPAHFDTKARIHLVATVGL